MRTQTLTILLLTLLAATFTLATPEASPANWGGYKGNSDVSFNSPPPSLSREKKKKSVHLRERHPNMNTKYSGAKAPASNAPPTSSGR